MKNGKSGQADESGAPSRGNEKTDLYRTLAEASPEMIYLIDPDGIVRYVNAAAAGMFQGPAESIVGKSLAELYPPEIAARHLTAIKAVVSTGNMLVSELKEVFPSGERWIDARLSPVRDGRGGVSGVLGLSQDITERKLAEKGLRESEERFRMVFDQGPMPMAMCGRDLRLVNVNAAFCAMIGYSREELANLTFKEITHPEHLEEGSSNVRSLIEGKISAYNAVKRYVSKDGRIIWAELSLSALRDGEGAFQRFLIMIKDITDRKLAEETLKASEANLEEAQRIARMGSWEWDIASNSLAWSKEMYRVMDIDPETFDGKLESLFKIVHPEDAKTFREAMKARLMSESPPSFEYRVIHRDRSIHMIRAEGRKVVDPSGRPVKSIGTVQDVTLIRKLQEDFQRIDKLDSLSILAGGIAHDFNNLLGGIFGYVDLAKNAAGESSKAAAFLEKALGTFNRAKALTQQLLTFSKGGEPKMKTGSLPPVLRENATFALSGSNVKMEFALSPDLWTCDFDENQIGQVVDNLVLNSIQAMPRGGTISIAAKNVELADRQIGTLGAGDYVMVSVKDSGQGILPEQLGRVFDPFFTTKAGGHGLGLATSFSILHKHGGHIEARSTPGEGSVFTFFLPATRAPVENQPAPDQGTVPRDGGTILVMDDEEFMREIIGEMLGSMGYRVVEAADGDEALRAISLTKARGETFRAAILDLTVPGGMGGAATMEAIRKDDPLLPIFAASGYSEDPVIAKPRESGFTDSIQKPFRRDALLRLLRESMPPPPRA